MLDSQKFELPDIKPMVALGIERILSSGYLATKIVPSIFKKPFFCWERHRFYNAKIAQLNSGRLLHVFFTKETS